MPIGDRRSGAPAGASPLLHPKVRPLGAIHPRAITGSAPHPYTHISTPPPSPQCPPPHRTAPNPTQNFSPRCGIDPETLPSSFLLFLSPPHTPLFHPPALSFAVGISFGAFSHRPGSVRLPPPISPPLHPLLYRGRDASERRNSGTFRF